MESIIHETIENVERDKNFETFSLCQNNRGFRIRSWKLFRNGVISTFENGMNEINQKMPKESSYSSAYTWQRFLLFCKFENSNPDLQRILLTKVIFVTDLLQIVYKIKLQEHLLE